VVDREGGCIVWGGNVGLSPADDVLIRVERPLDFDSDGQLVASVLSKKVAAGSTHVLIDVPVGPTAKVRTTQSADSLSERLQATAASMGLQLQVLRTDGRQPVGYGIGPALEASDVLAVLRREAFAPPDLRERALDLAGGLLDLVPGAVAGQGRTRAMALLDGGAALAKFLSICAAQGGFHEPTLAPYRRPVFATAAGKLQAIDNRRLAKVAKLAGAPGSAVAGVSCRLRLGDRVEVGMPLYEVHAQTPGELDYALAYVQRQPGILSLEAAP
jgi:thymidine phosphorylase